MEFEYPKTRNLCFTLGEAGYQEATSVLLSSFAETDTVTYLRRQLAAKVDICHKLTQSSISRSLVVLCPR